MRPELGELMPRSSRSPAPVSSPVSAPESNLTQEQPQQYTEAEVAAIAERLEQDEYETVFGCLDDWHALKAIAFHQPELVRPYVHLLELEVDED